MLEREEIESVKPDRDAQRTTLSTLAQAALKAEAVTGDPAWDTYCSYIQRALDVANQQRAAQMLALSSPQLVDHDKISMARNSVFLMDERIRCLEWVVTMPAEIKKVGSVAKEKLAQLDIETGDGDERGNG